MKVEILDEHGDWQALLGLSLSYNSEPSHRVADRLAHEQGGHNKFLESIIVWIDMTAPRYFWQQFDTYRVGTSKQSESTMHTILRKPLSQSSFEGGIHPMFLLMLNAGIKLKRFGWVKRHLPESFLQRRIVCTNYKVLQAMEGQRRSHKLPEWQHFLNEVQSQVYTPEYIRKEE